MEEVRPRPDLVLLAKARGELDQWADEAYSARRSQPHEVPLDASDLTGPEERGMTVALLRSLIDYQAFEFISEPDGNYEMLPLALADFIEAKDGVGGNTAATIAFRQLERNALRYAVTEINEALERRMPTENDHE